MKAKLIFLIALRFFRMPLTGLLILTSSYLVAQDTLSLAGGWVCKNIQEVRITGERLTKNGIEVKGWMPALVPGTVLTTLISNGIMPDPFYGMNGREIPDIYEKGNDFYTYWFYKEFKISVPENEGQVWLHLRGVNYSCDVFLNGKKVNVKRHYGMFLRQEYNITKMLNKKGVNRLAILVYPPDPPGNPNGGQGGDGVIAKNVMHQYVAGWDWIQPVADRNTGIWDKIYLERTGPVNLKNTHVVTRVEGKRLPEGEQEPAVVRISVEVQNALSEKVTGYLYYELNNETLKRRVELKANEIREIQLPDYVFHNPELWWPNGYGDQTLYPLKISFKGRGGELSDEENLHFGIREISTRWNPFTRSRQVFVNGRPVFIKGGNWIISDALLRFSSERYDAEIRMHQMMNLNAIRIWGGAITERPEFYEACDRYGILVMQDFWVSGDCNGRWRDPRKKDNQWTRRKYPDDHELFLESAADQIKMIRNHPSLAFWCGGNELPPPDDILIPLKDSLLANLDGTRWFVEYSNSDSMSFNFKGGNGDGPYRLQKETYFFTERSFPFNSEIGSVGLPDYEGLQRFLPEEAMVVPGQYKPEVSKGKGWRRKIHPEWIYHKYSPYGSAIEKYGHPTDVRDFAGKAQLVNFNQYRALIEGFSARMWDWYTGVMIWKTQNPWTAMRGQMYDYYLDPNGGLFGLRHGSEPLHIFYDPAAGYVMIANNTFQTYRNLMMEVNIYDMQGKVKNIYEELAQIFPSVSRRYGYIKRSVERLRSSEGCFMQMKLTDDQDRVISENFYWLPDSVGNYSGLQSMATANLAVSARKAGGRRISVKLKNEGINNPVAFFCRLALINAQTGKRVLPVFYSDNYISVVPGSQKEVIVEIPPRVNVKNLAIRIQGWNVRQVDMPVSP